MRNDLEEALGCLLLDLVLPLLHDGAVETKGGRSAVVEKKTKDVHEHSQRTDDAVRVQKKRRVSPELQKRSETRRELTAFLLGSRPSCEQTSACPGRSERASERSFRVPCPAKAEEQRSQLKREGKRGG